MRFNKLLYNNNFLKVFSVVIAAVAWYVVVTTVSQKMTVEIKDVPINFENIQGSSVENSGLNPINITKDMTVNVQLSGNRDVIGSVTKSDINIIPDLSGIKVAGIYDVELVNEVLNINGVKIDKISPKNISMQFDRIKSKKLKVQTNIVGMSVPEGYMMEEENVSPSEILISGPDMDVSKVAKVVASTVVDDTLTQTYTDKVKIKLLDKEDNVIKSKYISTNYEEVNITVPVLKTKVVPITFDYLSIPRELPIEDLKFKLSDQTMEIAGPVNLIDNFNEVNVGYVDIKELEDKNAFKFNINLPKGFINIENIKDVIVEFDTDKMTTEDIILSDLKLRNVPAIYDAEVKTRKIDVKMFGDSEKIKNLTADDIIGEIDLSDRDLSVGQVVVPVTVYAPTSGLVWSVGQYNAVINIKEK